MSPRHALPLALGLLACLALAPAARAEQKIDPKVEKFASFKVMGHVGDFNSKYVLLKSGKKHRIVPRHSMDNPDDIRPGRLAVAHLTAADLLEVSKYQKSGRLPP